MKILRYSIVFAFLVFTPTFTRAQKPEAPAQAVVVPFELLPTNHMVVMASINDGEPRRFIFDLGAPVTLLGGKAAEKAKVIDGKAPRMMLFAARGDTKVASFKVGDAEAKDMPVLVMDHPAVSALAEVLGKPIDGLIGYTFFARYRTTIDYQKKEMALQPVDFVVTDLFQTLPDQVLGGRSRAPKTQVLAPAGLWGFAVKAGEGGLEARGVDVTTVHEGSPAAEAGLRPGDTLVSLDGRWTCSVSDVYAAAAKVAPGQKVEVVARRAGEDMTLRITPREGL